MAPGVIDQIRKGWNAFVNVQEDFVQPDRQYTQGVRSSVRPDRIRFTPTNERSIISSLYNRMGIDVASVPIRHVKLDKDGQYLEDMDSGLNNCLTLEANIDQGARHFRQDIVMTMFDKGVVALVPVDTSKSPLDTSGFDILTLRTGEIIEWAPRTVRIRVYNDRTGEKDEITLPKSVVAIIENPFYTVMNEPNSTLQRLVRKLNLLDSVDEQTSSGKLDILIQLPYTIRTDLKRREAEQRRKDIEEQLKGSQYGIAYIDGTERVTQLNRPSENNLLKQVEYLTSMLYGQLGMTESVFNGTASEAEMLNYQNRTENPILVSITEAMKRTFLTKTARSQKQSVEFYRDPFKLVSAATLAELADKLTRNEIVSSNEMRGFMGIKPSKDPKADELRNKNLQQAEPIDPLVEPTI